MKTITMSILTKTNLEVLLSQQETNLISNSNSNQNNNSIPLIGLAKRIYLSTTNPKLVKFATSSDPVISYPAGSPQDINDLPDCQDNLCGGLPNEESLIKK